MHKLTIFVALVLCSFTSPSPPPDKKEPPSEHDQNFNAALKAQNARDYEAAIGFYQKAIGEEKDDADAWNNMGYCYRMIAKDYLNKAGDAYAKAIRYNPQHEAALEYQGEYFVMVGLLMSAYRNYEALEKMGSKEASKVLGKLDSVLEEAEAVLKLHQP